MKLAGANTILPGTGLQPLIRHNDFSHTFFLTAHHPPLAVPTLVIQPVVALYSLSMSKTSHPFHSPLWVNFPWRTTLCTEAPETVNDGLDIVTNRLEQCSQMLPPEAVVYLRYVASLIDIFIVQVGRDDALATNLGLRPPGPADSFEFRGYSGCIKQQEVIQCLLRCVFLDRVLWAHGVLPCDLVQRRHSLTPLCSDQISFGYDQFIPPIKNLVDSAHAAAQSLSAPLTLDDPSQLTAVQGSSHKLMGKVQDTISDLFVALTGTLWCLEQDNGQTFANLLEKIKEMKNTSTAIPPAIVEILLSTFENFNFVKKKAFIYMWFHSVTSVFSPRFPGPDGGTTLDQVLQRTAIPVSMISGCILSAERALIRYYIKLLSSTYRQVANGSTQMFDETLLRPSSDFSQLIADLDLALQQSDPVVVRQEAFTSRITGFYIYQLPPLRPPTLFYTGYGNREINQAIKRLRDAMEDQSANKRQRIQSGHDGLEVVEDSKAPQNPPPSQQGPVSPRPPSPRNLNPQLSFTPPPSHSSPQDSPTAPPGPRTFPTPPDSSSRDSSDAPPGNFNPRDSSNAPPGNLSPRTPPAPDSSLWDSPHAPPPDSSPRRSSTPPPRQPRSSSGSTSPPPSSTPPPSLSSKPKPGGKGKSSAKGPKSGKGPKSLKDRKKWKSWSSRREKKLRKKQEARVKKTLEKAEEAREARKKTHDGRRGDLESSNTVPYEIPTKKKRVNEKLPQTGMPKEAKSAPAANKQGTAGVHQGKEAAKKAINLFARSSGLKDFAQLMNALAMVDIVDLIQDDDDDDDGGDRSSKIKPLGEGDKRIGKTLVTHHDIAVWVPFVNPAGDVDFEKKMVNVPFTNNSYPFEQLQELLTLCGFSGDEAPEAVDFVCTMPKSRFNALPVSEQRRLWRKGCLHLFEDEKLPPPSPSLNILKELGVNLRQSRKIYENQRALSYEEPPTGIRRGSLLSLFSMAADDRLDCNVLDIPLPHAHGYLPPKSLKNLSLNQELQHIDAPIPAAVNALQWCLFASPPARTGIHIDAGKFHTWINPQSGLKLWMVQESSPEVEEVNTLTNMEYTSGRWHGTILKPGDEFIMRANTNHIVVTLAESVTMGGHFYSVDNLERTMIAGRREYFWGAAVTNTVHTRSEAMIYRLGVFLFEQMMGKDKASQLLGKAEIERFSVPPELESDVYPYLVFMLLNPDKFVPQEHEGDIPSALSSTKVEKLRTKARKLACLYLKMRPNLIPQATALESRRLLGEK